MKTDSILKALALWLYPPKCMLCSEIIPLNRKKLLCFGCEKTMDITKELFCCSPPGKVYFDKAIGIVVYENQITTAIRKMKYQKRTDYATEFGMLMGKKTHSLFGNQIDGIIPVPLHEKRQQQRGYNQSELIAKEICNYTKIPLYNNLLIRTKYTEAQYQLNRQQRFENMSGAFSISSDYSFENLNGKTFLLIDDIYTTGATLNECARVLKLASSGQIYAYTLSVTP